MYILEFVFYQIVSLRLRHGIDLDEASHTAAVFMTMPWIALAVIIDLGVASTTNMDPMHRIIGKWQFGIVVFAVAYFVHYRLLIRDGKSERIAERLSRQHTGRRLAILGVIVYLFLVPAVSTIFGFYLSG